MDTSYESESSPTKHLNGSSYSVENSKNNNGEVYNGYSEKKHKDKHKEKHKDKDKDKERHKHKSHKHDKDRDRKDRDKEKSHKDKDKEKSSSNSSEKDKSKHEKSSSKSSSEKSPEKSHKSKHKDKHREKDREKDKEKDREKHKEKDRDREKDRSDKKSSSASTTNNNSSSGKPNAVEVKPEVISPVKQEHMASPASDSEDDVPLGQRQSMNNNSNSTHTTPKQQQTVVKKEEEESDEDDVPLSNRKSKNSETSSSKKRRPQDDSEDDDVPLIHRTSKKVKTESKPRVKKRARSESEDSEEEYNAKKKSKSKAKPSLNKSSSKSSSASANASPVKKGRKGKKEEEEEEIWEWWKEEKRDDGVKWKFLEHKGPVFAPPYEPLPKHIRFKYDGKPVKLSEDAEEIAGFYSRFIEHDYTTKEKFNTNFFKDWRKAMTKSEKELITDLRKCDFSEINEYYKQKSEERKAMSKEEKLKIKEENEAIQKEYGTCILDGHKEKIGNFRIEPPGLFRGRGEHPKMGMLKRRLQPEDVIINCSKDSKVPVPPAGHKWKEVKHDNSVTWLACWTENVQGQSKYVMLNPTSRLKGEKDWMKYETARKLAKKIDKIRENYREDFRSKEMRVRQRAVALYFIDKLALRAGNEKDEDQADTVGCCSLRYEHIQLFSEKDGKENVVVFDFLGKDSIRYYNEVEVDKRVFKNLKIFMDNKKEGDDLFDRLNTQILNKHLSELMDGLTAKVFRTYNASHTLQQQLDELTEEDATVAQKVLAYNRANRKVAILCNHQRAVPKSHEKSMENLINKIESKREEIKNVKKELKKLPRGKEHEKKSLQLERLKSQLEKLELNRQDKDEGKEIALGTSKLNYLDPRITAAWCKKHDVPLEKVYNKTQRAKFTWAISMIQSSDEEFRFD